MCGRIPRVTIAVLYSCSSPLQSYSLDRSANILSAVGISTTAGSVPNAVPVSISSIMYTDFLTGGPATDVTATWVSQVSFPLSLVVLRWCIQIFNLTLIVTLHPTLAPFFSYAFITWLMLMHHTLLSSDHSCIASQSCATTGYADVAAFTSSKSGCKFPSTLSSVLHTTNDDGILNYPTSTAICQGFVTGVSYSIQVKFVFY